MIKLPVFKEKKYSYLHSSFAYWDCAASQTPNCIWNKLTCQHLVFLLSFFPLLLFFFESSSKQKCFLNLWSIKIFFYFWDRPWYFRLMCLKIALYSLFGQAELCLIFILIKNVFHSGVLLKMPPSSPSMEEIDLYIQKWINLKEAKAYLSRNDKYILRNTSFKGSFKYNKSVCFTEHCSVKTLWSKLQQF